MRIYLLRHGDAEDLPPEGGGDEARRLTDKGEAQSRLAGQALARLELDLTTCLASPKVRAHETARLACQALGISVEIEDRLRGGDFDPEDLAAGRGSTLLVGHDPDFSRAVQASTGARVKFKKGGIAVIQGGLLLALLRPADLKLIAG